MDEVELKRKKKVRFPKGKKVKPREKVVIPVNVPQVAEDEPTELKDTHLVVKARSKRQNQDKIGLINEENGYLLDFVAVAEMHCRENKTLEDDKTRNYNGIQLEGSFNRKEKMYIMKSRRSFRGKHSLDVCGLPFLQVSVKQRGTKKDKEVKYLSVLRASLVSRKENVSTNLSYWKVSAFSEVEKLGQASPTPASLPIKKDVAKIMSNLRNNLYTILAHVPFLVELTDNSEKLKLRSEINRLTKNSEKLKLQNAELMIRLNIYLYYVVITNLEGGLVTELEVKKLPDPPGDNLVKHFP
ncbi:uncharacterized protein LOC111882452 [Lactuca sativa]|uniref:uncharacterized protein LOC111882452 n=1 Tax=Lactuca sativa TaxID=4236 RepID=UPI0022AFFD07|nr:uncharacterized protein LOC111882452 [Lactuca sativa]